MRSMQRKLGGFTLIELMIAVAIVGLLAAVAYPSYQDSVRKGRRIDAKNTLLGLQLEVEKRRANNITYATDLTTLPVAGGPGAYLSLDGFYSISFDAADANTFQITATPVAGSDQANDSCGEFIINQNGPDTSTAARRNCWGM